MKRRADYRSDGGVQEFYPLGEEYLPMGQEDFPTGHEDLWSGHEDMCTGEEIFPSGAGESVNRKDGDKRRKASAAKINKMGYLVAASISVVAVGTAATGYSVSSAYSMPSSGNMQSNGDVPSGGNAQNNGDVWYVGDPDDPENWYIISDSRETVEGVRARENGTFPQLTNLDPNTPVQPYGALNEQYVMIFENGNRQFVYAGSAYTDYNTPETVSGVRYDIVSNTLYLTNCDIGVIYFNWMGNGFRIDVSGTNKVKGIVGYGFYSGGSVTITGSGNLTVDGEGFESGSIRLYAEQSETCLMVDDSIEYLDVYGNRDGAIVVCETTAQYPVYYRGDLRMYGGESFMMVPDGIVSEDRATYPSYAVAENNGGDLVRAEHVEFRHPR